MSIQYNSFSQQVDGWKLLKITEKIIASGQERMNCPGGVGMVGMMACTGRLLPKGIPFSGFGYMKG